MAKADKFKGGNPEDFDAGSKALIDAAVNHEAISRGLDRESRRAYDAIGASYLADAVLTFGVTYGKAIAQAAIEMRTLAETSTTQATKLREASE